MFTFNPKAVEGQVCLESSPNDNKIYFMHTSRAIMLEVGGSFVPILLITVLYLLDKAEMIYFIRPAYLLSFTNCNIISFLSL